MFLRFMTCLLYRNFGKNPFFEWLSDVHLLRMANCYMGHVGYGTMVATQTRVSGKMKKGSDWGFLKSEWAMVVKIMEEASIFGTWDPKGKENRRETKISMGRAS